MREMTTTRPQRIASMREAMQELGRASTTMREALHASNDEIHQAFFADVLNRVGMIVANERQGITNTLADDLTNLRSAVRRLRLPDIDPDLQVQTPALKTLRGERGNLIEAIDNALDAAALLRMRPRVAEFGAILIERREVAEQLIRLDERLRIVEDSVTNLRSEAAKADATSDANLISQTGLVSFHVQTLKVELNAARFETKMGGDLPTTHDLDIASLGRSIEGMKEVAGDLREAVEGLGNFMADGVRVASGILIAATERSWKGLKTVVTLVRRKLERRHVIRKPELPADFDLEEIHAMILRGEIPKPSWQRWVTELSFDKRKDLQTLAPIEGLTNLKELNLNGTQVNDLAPLAGLANLKALNLNDTPVKDLTPLAGLTSLETLTLDDTQVENLGPLAELAGLDTLSLKFTRVNDLAPLVRLASLRTLQLTGTQVKDLAPLSGFASLETLNLKFTQVSELALLAGLSSLRELYLDGTHVSDLTPLSVLANLQRLDLDSTQVIDLAPLAVLAKLETLSLQDTQVSDLAPLADLVSLGRLDLEGTQISDLASLAGLKQHVRVWVESESRKAALTRTVTSDQLTIDTLEK